MVVCMCVEPEGFTCAWSERAVCLTGWAEAGLSRLYDCAHPVKLAPHIKVAITDGHLSRYCVIFGR